MFYRLQRPLCILFPKMRAYRRDFDEAIFIPFFIKDDGLLLEKCNKIWKRVSDSNKNI